MNFISRFSELPSRRVRPPIVYFAGRMSLCAECDTDWRHPIVGANVLPDDTDYTVAPRTVVDFGSFLYGGPFLIDGTGGHTRGHCLGYDDEERQRIWNNDLYQIKRCDLFVAWLEDLQAFGTLVEIGIASGLGKPIVLGLSSELSDQEVGELWFAGMAASQVIRAKQPREFWRQVMADWLGRPS